MDRQLALSLSLSLSRTGSAPKLQHCIVITKKLTPECYCMPNMPNMPVEMHRGLSLDPLYWCATAFCHPQWRDRKWRAVDSHWGEGLLTLHPSPQDCSWCWTTDVQSPTCFHTLTGCDSTSALSGVGKKKVWKIIVTSKVHQQHLVCVGQSPDMDSVTTRKAEAFICSLYNISKRTPTSADKTRYSSYRRSELAGLRIRWLYIRCLVHDVTL